jgi:hypothetical protein
MNTEASLTNDQILDSPPESVPVLDHRGNGKVARLPKAIRDQINHWLLDGLSYTDIIERLGEPGKHLNADHLSEWKKRGYQSWLMGQAFLEQTRLRQEVTQEMVQDFDGTQVNHAALQLGTLHIFEALRDLGPGSLDKKLGGDCGAFARLVNALARASRETMQLQTGRAGRRCSCRSTARLVPRRGQRSTS